MDLDALLTHCRLADGRLVDIGIAGGRIATIGEDAAPLLSNRVPILDIGGDLVLPGLVDGHMHLDKTLMGLPWMPHMAGPTRMSRIETDKTILPHLPVSTEERAGNLIEACVARGTAHLRTHVDIDLESRLSKLDGVLAARERHRGLVNVQIVAFPQSGVMRCPGVLDLLDAAVSAGAERRNQHRAHPIRTPWNRIGLSMDQERFAHLIPGKRNLFTAGFRTFCPEITHREVAGDGMAVVGFGQPGGGARTSDPAAPAEDRRRRCGPPHQSTQNGVKTLSK